MEYAVIEREIYVDASPEVVFDVVSSPEHLSQWWPDDTDVEPTPGAAGHITFRGTPPDETVVEPMTVVEVEPPRRFSFRWNYEEGVVPEVDNSMLVVFDLEPSGAGTRVRMTETGFRERGWEAAVLEHAYQDHVEGWDHFIPRLGAYVARLVSSS